jgi:hypothetical protein
VFRIKARVRKYLAERKLQKSGCVSWRQYRHNHDPDVIHHADKVSDFYSNYKYVYRCSTTGHYAYECVADWGPGGLRFGYDDMSDWCESKCRFKYRSDIHRVYCQTGIGIDGDTHEDWWFNDIGGGDNVYFAFMNEQDYIMFVLRWG